MIKDTGIYFEDTILPSVGIPKKGTYNLTEVATILGVHRTTIRRYTHQRRLTISPAKKVYHRELIRFFDTKE